MELRPEHITIAVTVFNRREYVLAAIRSALNQTIPVKVIVVEDCGPDPGLQTLIQGEFGDRIEYFRNRQNRGLFDNWNACMEYCRTPWFSILHDDDLLLPDCVEALLDLAKAAPGRALYFGRINRLMPDGSLLPPEQALKTGWRELGNGEGLTALLNESVLGFPGHLISIGSARQAGGFRKNSWYTGDWDMWFRLALISGAAESGRVLAVGRCHDSFDRASSRIVRRGWKWLLDNVQRKRNLALLHQRDGTCVRFDRALPQKDHPIPLRLLLVHATGFSRRVLFYNWWLFIQSQPPHWRYALAQSLARALGPQSLRLAARVGGGRPLK